MAGDAALRQRRAAFATARDHALGKCDKSSAGRIDPKAVSVCAAVNSQQGWFTTSSCAGRCYLWQGVGIKATDEFARGRVSHELVDSSYFVGELAGACGAFRAAPLCETVTEGAVWLRFEPFILHVRCIDASAARELVKAARAVFKNVGLQGVDEDEAPQDLSRGQKRKQQSLVVAIVGDEGLEMPLRSPSGEPLFFEAKGQAQWLVDIVNEKHLRNWAKIDRFETAVLEASNRLSAHADAKDDDDASTDDDDDEPAKKAPKSYDVIGDVAVLRSALDYETLGPTGIAAVGDHVLKTNRKIKVVVAPEMAANMCSSALRAPALPLRLLAGRARAPLLTTHVEAGVRIVVDLDACFFSPRLFLERLRLCKCVAPGERILVLFSGCGPEALHLAKRTEAAEVVAVEMNATAVACLRRSLEVLRRSAGDVAADRVRVVESDVLEDLARRRAALDAAGTLKQHLFDRVVAPRPKSNRCGEREGAVDASAEDDGGGGGGGVGGEDFLTAILPLVRPGGEVHWTDFAADHELPRCERSRDFIERVCADHGVACEFLHSARAGSSVAKRQYRVTIDFRVLPRTAASWTTTEAEHPGGSSNPILTRH
ncbi:S-adenosyl-L-methionine-dependent methyltransferase [Pelagophyceae sp. CCMP2097]|nr:S-adenosyl-L-methionine-dependent methyltransferase [Pelagophyceae sp. CCMP2097]